MRMFVTLLCVLALAAAPAFAASETIVVVVRHAEKGADDPIDPTLSAAGEARANALAKALANIPITSAFTTQYKRTALTAEPTAREHGITVTAIPANKENAAAYGQVVADRVRKEAHGKASLVVGHSNTVPDVVFALSGVKVEPLAESEFDRLYVITLPAKGKPRVVAARY